MTPTVCIYIYADRFCHTDGIAYLHQHLVGYNAPKNEVFRRDNTNRKIFFA